MIFTVPEMEMLCMFYSGSRKATIEMLEKAADEMDARGAERSEAVRSILKKLTQMRDSEAACIRFDG